MRASLIGVLAVASAACGAVEVNIKPQKVETVISTRVDSTAVCTQQPFGSSSIDFAAMAKEAGLDLKSGCLKSAQFELTAEVTTLTGGSMCAEPRGIVTLTQFEIELTCDDARTQSIIALCPRPTIDVADGTDVFLKLNDCLNVVEVEESERLRRLINSCRPTQMRAFGRGSCSADTCFAASFKVIFKLISAVGVLGGTCP